MFGNWWHKKEKPLPGMMGFGGGATGLSQTGLGAFSASGGDVITSPYPDGGSTYKAHVFTSSGSFVVTGEPNSVQYLVVGGGGGAGSFYSGGGGGGGFRSSLPGIAPGGPGTSVETALTLGPGTYTVTVGAGGGGGAWSPPAGAKGTSGGNSVFATITSQGGGGSGTNSPTAPPAPGYNGGSGGGAASIPGSSTEGSAGYERQTTGTGSPTPVQGFPGGEGGPWPGGGYSSTGGGGAGGAGGAADGTNPGGGPGGAGKAIPVTMFGPTTPSYGAPGPSAGRWFAGGGGGSSYNFPGAAAQDGSGGSSPGGGGPYAGGGDGGRAPATPTRQSEAGLDNTGGGAGGTAPLAPWKTPKAGGPGIVIVRYTV